VQAHTRAAVDEAVHRGSHPAAKGNSRSRRRGSRSRSRVDGGRTPGAGASRAPRRDGDDGPASPRSQSRAPIHTQLATFLGLEEDGSPARPNKHKEKYDPDEYTHAKKKLKKAVLEHYRVLEL
jgi:hypothetical protein